jgi:hypothetical protein
LEVLVQLVIAAISTSPLPMVTSCTFHAAALDWRRRSVGLLASISTSELLRRDRHGRVVGLAGPSPGVGHVSPGAA